MADREFFLEPPPQAHAAINLLDTAAEAIIAGNREKAITLIEQADMGEIAEWANQLWRKTIPSIHRYPAKKGYPPASEEPYVSMPGDRAQRYIFTRDGWRCQYCGVHVISPEARKKETRVSVQRLSMNRTG